MTAARSIDSRARPVSIEDVISAKELAGQSLLITWLPLLRRILGQGSPLIETGLIEAGLIDPDGLKAAVTEQAAASSARSAQSIPGPGLPRRSTATS
jgi:hypothetical protein